MQSHLQPVARSVDIARASHRILDWILDGPAIVRAGPERGGVCGWLDGHGPVFVYGEATGYYCTALAAAVRRVPASRTRASACAQRVVDWVAGHIRALRLPPTRSYLQPHVSDWRCSLQFAFDLTMLARGLHDAKSLLPESRLTPLLTPILAAIEQLIGDDGRLAACRPTQPGVEFPTRWSTRPGFYQTKIVAALRTRSPASSPRLAAACDHILARWSRPPRLRGGLHQYLYGLEGSALLVVGRGDDAALHPIADALRRVLALCLPDGSIPASARNREPRIDVLAQTVRLAALLRLAGHSVPIVRSVDALLRAVGDDGAVRFGAEGTTTGAHRNVWATLFAWQALSWLAAAATDEPCTAADLALLV